MEKNSLETLNKLEALESVTIENANEIQPLEIKEYKDLAENVDLVEYSICRCSSTCGSNYSRVECRCSIGCGSNYNRDGCRCSIGCGSNYSKG